MPWDATAAAVWTARLTGVPDPPTLLVCDVCTEVGDSKVFVLGCELQGFLDGADPSRAPGRVVCKPCAEAEGATGKAEDCDPWSDNLGAR